MMSLGVIFAIIASIFWTLSTHIWRDLEIKITAIELNLVKTTLAAIIMLPMLFFIPYFEETRSIILLIFSGILGISIGDSFFIAALRRIGATNTLTVESAAPVLANLFGSLLLFEKVTPYAWLGSLCVGLSLVLVSVSNNNDNLLNSFNKIAIDNGFWMAIIAVLCGILGAAISRYVFTTSIIMPYQSSSIRLFSGSLFLFSTSSSRFKILNKLNLNKDEFPRIVLATIIGTNIAIFLQQSVFYILPLGIGVTILSASPIVSLFISKLQRKNINNISIFSPFLAVLGVLLSFI